MRVCLRKQVHHMWWSVLVAISMQINVQTVSRFEKKMNCVIHTFFAVVFASMLEDMCACVCGVP